MMKVIGLTGGIGSGKSTASEYLARKGCLIVDADAISRGLTANGSPYLATIRKTFGDEYFFDDGGLNRQKLGRLVFENPEKKAELERIITDEVIRIVLEKFENLRAEGFDGIAVLDAPLFFECNMQRYTDEAWLVAAEPDIVIERVKSRDGLSEEDIRSRIASQMSLAEKKALASRVIDNSTDLPHLYAQLDEALDKIYCI